MLMKVDLGDAVADELNLPFEQISLEMIYRGLYHFNVAYNKGKANHPVQYFSDPKNQHLGIVKRKRKPNTKLIIAPFPDRQRGQENFFFQNPLTSCSSA
ncbi:transposase, IS4 [Calothrix sp. NIES-4101]|nr:transposase, IS4 [Calothrix sp. NIES-4101]BAZ37321.1 transposase, IS4 [Calothrix sp. NIES-4101]